MSRINICNCNFLSPSDRWNVLDLITLVIYFGTFILRIITWGISTSVPGNRPLVIAQYLYGLNATILTFRVFGSLLEANKGTGITHIALVRIVEDVAIIFVQFFVGILACSLAMTKVLLAEHSFRDVDEGVSRSEGLEFFFFYCSLCSFDAYSFLCFEVYVSTNFTYGFPNKFVIKVKHFLR